MIKTIEIDDFSYESKNPPNKKLRFHGHLTLPNIGWRGTMYPLLGDRQYLPDDKAMGDLSLLLFIYTYLTHSGHISWLYHFNY